MDVALGLLWQSFNSFRGFRGFKGFRGLRAGKRQAWTPIRSLRSVVGV